MTTLNNLGTISGWDGIWSNGTITSLHNSGIIANSGVIAGNIRSTSYRDLVIHGGSGATFGLLNGVNGSVGFIENLNADVVFGAGNQRLHSNINVGDNQVSSIGRGTFQVNTSIAITGNYQQGTNSTLNIGVGDTATSTGSFSNAGYGRLVVSGSAIIDAGASVAVPAM